MIVENSIITSYYKLSLTYWTNKLLYLQYYYYNSKQYRYEMAGLEMYEGKVRLFIIHCLVSLHEYHTDDLN